MPLMYHEKQVRAVIRSRAGSGAGGSRGARLAGRLRHWRIKPSQCRIKPSHGRRTTSPPGRRPVRRPLRQRAPAGAQRAGPGCSGRRARPSLAHACGACRESALPMHSTRTPMQHHPMHDRASTSTSLISPRSRASSTAWSARCWAARRWRATATWTTAACSAARCGPEAHAAGCMCVCGISGASSRRLRKQLLAKKLSPAAVTEALP